MVDLALSTRVHSHSLGPPSSNVASFQVDVTPGVNFCAYATSDGCIIVQMALHGTASGLGPQQPPRVHGPPTACGQFITALVADQLKLSDTIELIAWGGGPSYLLAACTAQHIHIFSLRTFFRNELQAFRMELLGANGLWGALPKAPVPCTGALLAARQRLAHTLLAVDWTHDSSGLLYTDVGNNVTMLLVCCSLGFGASDSEPQVVVDILESWSVKSDTPHVLAAAGGSPYQQCATTPAPSEHKGHKVIIWWPKEEEHPPPTEGEGVDGGNKASGEAAGVLALDRATSCYPGWRPVASTGAEAIRHPVKVLSLEWSPTLSPGGAACGTDPAGGTASSSSPASLALMTVGADWVIRIWVEVVMRDLFPGSKTAPAGLTTSQFCLTLVIEPPNLGLVPESLPGLRACWARPLLPQISTGGSSAGDTASSYAGAAGLAAIAVSSRVHWVVASVGVPRELKKGAPFHLDECVCLWAVDSLSGVTLSSLPHGGALCSSKTVSPKAVLWGHGGRVAWLQPQEAYQSRKLDYSVRAYVTYPDYVPVVHALDHFQSHDGCYGEIRCYDIATVTEDTGPASWPHTSILVSNICHQPLSGSPESLQGLDVQPGTNMAVCVDKQGLLGFWCLSPVEELPLRFPPSGRSASMQLLADPTTHVTATAWLPLPSTRQAVSGGVLTPNGGQRGLCGACVLHLACAFDHVLHVYALAVPDAAAYGGPALIRQERQSWCVLILKQVLSLELPNGFNSIMSIMSTLSDETPKPCLTLVCLASKSSSCGGVAEHQQHVAEDVAEYGTSGSTALGEAWVTWCLAADLAVPLETNPLQGGGVYAINLVYCQMADGPEQGGLTCCQQPPASCSGLAQDRFITGSSVGAVQIWGLSPKGPQVIQELSIPGLAPPLRPQAVDTPSTPFGGAASQLGPASSAASSTPTGVLLCVVLHPSGCYAAAASTCGTDDLDDSVHIWREVVRRSWKPHSVDSVDSVRGEDDLDHERSEDQAVYALDAVVALEDTARSLTWLNTSDLCPVLVVGHASGLIQYLCKSHVDASWTTVAEYRCSVPVNSTVSIQGGGLALAAGNQLMVLSNAINPPARANFLEANDPSRQATGTVGQLSAGLSGSLAPYHPQTLKALIHKGKLVAACRLVRSLIKWMVEHDKSLEEQGVDYADSMDGGEEGPMSDALTATDQVKKAALHQSALMADASATLLKAVPLSDILGLSVSSSQGTGAPPGGAAPSPSSECLLSSRGLAVLHQLLAPEAHYSASGAGFGSASVFGSSFSSQSKAFNNSSKSSQAPPFGLPTSSKPSLRDLMSASTAMETERSISLRHNPALHLAHSSEHSGNLDASTAGGTAAGRPSALDTGMLDMSAFGGFGAGDEPAPPAPATAPPAPSSPDTGMLDMSAFGGFGAAQDEPEPQPTPPPEPTHRAVPAQQPAQQPPPDDSIHRTTSMVDVMLGMLATSGFGSFGDLGSVNTEDHSSASASRRSPPHPPSAPPPPPGPPNPPGGSLDTGMLDLSAFGMNTHVQEEEQPPAPAHDPMASGMLDMSSFGMGRMVEPAPPLSRAPAPAHDPMASGMLDMSAFGMRTHIQEEEPPRAPAPAHNPMASGMLDMSSFGMGRMVKPAPPPSPAHDPMASGMLDMSAFGMNTHVQEKEQPPPAPAHDAMSSGMLDMSSFGMGGMVEQAPKQPARTAALAGSDIARATRPSPPPQTPSNTAASTSATAATAAAAEEHKRWGPSCTFPRMLEPSAAASLAMGEALPKHMLSPEEVDTLQKLLNVKEKTPNEGGGWLSTVISEDSLPTSLLPSYLQEVNPEGEAKARAAKLVDALGLGHEEALELLYIARALKKVSTSQPGGGGAPAYRDAPGDSGDVAAGLDSSARVFLISARLAAEEDEASPPPVEGGVQSNLGSAPSASSDFQSSRPSPFSAFSSNMRPIASSPAPPVPAPLGGAQARVTGQPPSRAKPSVLTEIGSRGVTALRAARMRGVRSERSLGSALSFGSAASGSLSFRAGSSVSRAGLAQPTGPQSWWRSTGAMDTLTACSVLWALASGGQAALLDAALPHIPYRSSEEVTVSPNADSAAMRPVSSVAASLGRTMISWPQYRRLGVGLWLTDPPAVQGAAEALAKAQYSRNKDPYDCMLMYIALGKRAMLINLFRQANNRKVTDFMGKNFADANNRNAAAKNAYALLGQHRYELAAAFFILAGAHKDALGVLTRERSDPQLALFVGRLLSLASPPGASAVQSLIEEDYLPMAKSGDGSCTVSVLLWLAGRPAEAVENLAFQAVPVEGGGKVTPNPYALDFLMHCGIQQLSGKSVPKSITQGVAMLALHACEQLRNQGLPLPALDALLLAHSLSQREAEASPTEDTPGGGVRPPKQGGAAAQRLANLCGVLIAGVLAPSIRPALPPGESPLTRLHGGTAGGAGKSSGGGAVPSAPSEWRLGQAKQLHLITPLPSLRPGLSPLSQVAKLLDDHRTSLSPMTNRPLLLPWSKRTLVPDFTLSEGGAPSTSLKPRPSFGDGTVTPSRTGGASPILSPACPGDQTSRLVHSGRSPGDTSEGGGLGRRTSVSSIGLRPNRSYDGSIPSPRSSVDESARSWLTGWTTGSGSHTLALHGLLGESYDVFNMEGDKCRALACSPMLLSPAGLGSQSHAFAVATTRSGLVHSEVQVPDALLPLPHGGEGGAEGGGPGTPPTGSAHPASMFLGLMQQVLQHVRWNPDPWAAMSGSGAKPEGSGASVSSQAPTPRSGSSGLSMSGFSFNRLASTKTGGLIQAQSSTTHAAAVVAHPGRDTFLSGSSGDHIFMWRFGSEASTASYVPMLDPHHSIQAGAMRLIMPDLVQAPNWESAVRIRYSRTGSRFAGIGEGGLVALWRPEVEPFGSGGLRYADWTHHCVPKRGSDIAFVGDVGSQLLACGHGDRGTGGVVSWWDTMLPSNQACVAALRGLKHDPTSMCLVHAPAGPLLVVGDDAGDLNAHDLRMMGSKAPIWKLNRVHHGAVTNMHCWAAGDADLPNLKFDAVAGNGARMSGSDRPGAKGGLSPRQSEIQSSLNGASLSRSTSRCSTPTCGKSEAHLASTSNLLLKDLLVSGGRDGCLSVIDVIDGRLVATYDKAHYTVTKNPLAALANRVVNTVVGQPPPTYRGSVGGAPPAHATQRPRPANTVGCPVTGLCCMYEGILSSGMDGVVRFHPLHHSDRYQD